MKTSLSLAIAISLVLSSTAFATGKGKGSNDHHSPKPQVHYTANPSSNSNSTSIAGAGASAESAASATSTSDSSSGSTSSVNISSSHRDRLQAPALAAPSFYSSSVCYYGVSAGLSIPGGAITGGKSIEDAGCSRREDARTLHQMGFTSLALKVMCNSKYVQEVASAADCAILLAAYEEERRLSWEPTPFPTEEPTGISPEVAAKFQEQDEKIDRAFKKAMAK